MIVNRLKDILKANINAQWEKLSEQEFLDDWKKYFESDEDSSTYKESDFKSHEEEWREYQQQKRQAAGRSTQASKEAAYYADLELPVGADFATIKKSYRKMVKLYHPDLFQHDSQKQEVAKEVTRKINEAYDYFEKKYGK